MERRNFLKTTLIATGSLLFGGSAIYRLRNDKEQGDAPLPATIEKVHRGDGKNVLVLMSAGTRSGNTDRLTDAYIKGAGNEKGVYCAGGCTGCESLARQIEPKHLENAYQLGLKL